MRIGIEVSALSRLRTGVGHYVARLLEELLRRDDGHEYLLFSDRVPAPNGSESPGATIVPGHLSARWLWLQTELPVRLRRAGVDLCCFTNSVAPVHQRVPGVVVIHDASLFVVPAFHPLRRVVATATLTRLAARRASAIVTLTDAARRDLLAALDLPPERVHVIHGAPAPGFAPVTDPETLARTQRAYDLPTRFVLSVATLEPRKNLLRLLRAHQRARSQGLDHELLLVGVRGWQTRELERAVAGANGVRALGYVPTEDLPSLYSLTTAAAYPSLYEGFGLPLVEAMACGAPVLASDRPWAREVCLDAAAFVEPTDEDALTAALLDLTSDHAWRRELAARGLRRARQFSWATSAEQMVTVFETVGRE